MAKPSFISALKSDRCVHYLNNFLVNRAQSIDVNANVPTQIIDELGNDRHAGMICLPAEVGLSISVFDTGMELGKNLTGKSTATKLTLDDYLSAKVDYVGVVRDNSGNFFRSVYIKGASIASLSYGFDVSGNATEAYSLVGDNMTVFDGFVVTKTYDATATADHFVLPLGAGEAPIQTKADSYFEGQYLLRVSKIENGVETTLEKGDYTYSSENKRITLVNDQVKSGQKWTVVFYSEKTATPIAPAFDKALPPAVRGEFTPLSIGITAKQDIPRLQSAAISVNLKQVRVPQLGSKKILHAPGGVPEVGGSFKILMTDLSLRKLLTYGDNEANETQFGIEQMPLQGIKTDMGLEVLIKSPTDNTQILKRIVVPDIVTSSGGTPATVNGTLMETYSWSGKTGALEISNS